MKEVWHGDLSQSFAGLAFLLLHMNQAHICTNMLQVRCSSSNQARLYAGADQDIQRGAASAAAFP